MIVWTAFVFGVLAGSGLTAWYDWKYHGARW